MATASQTIKTKPFEGQKPGTSGLRKATKIFMQENYTENFVQCTLNAALGDKLKGCSLAIGGDGRFYGREAVVKIIQMCAANGVSCVKKCLSFLWCCPSPLTISQSLAFISTKKQLKS